MISWGEFVVVAIVIVAIVMQSLMIFDVLDDRVYHETRADDHACEVKCLRIDRELLIRSDNLCVCDDGTDMKLFGEEND